MNERLTRLVDGILTIAADVDLETMLQNIVDAACDVAGAQYGALGVVGDDEFLSRFVFTGLDQDAVTRIGRLPQGQGILRLLIEHPEPIRIADLSTHPASVGFPEGHPPMSSFLGAPVRVHGQVFGNLYLTEKIDGERFTQDDEDLIVGLATVAGAVIANAELFSEVQRLSLIEERERIGRDLHDTVIQRLFATGLTLQAIARRCDVAAPEVATQITDAVDELDATIREIRGVIFSLSTGDVHEGLRARVVHVARQLTPTLGFEPRVRFVGPVDLVTDLTLAEHVIAVLREALTNVAKHAGASTVEVELAATTERLTLRVRDDGTGPSAEGVAAGGLGLSNLARRAERLDGWCELTAADPGAELRWEVPL